VNDGQCGLEGDTCCSGQHHGTLSCGFSVCKALGCESMCETLASKLLTLLGQHSGCDKVKDKADSICSAIGVKEGLLLIVCKEIVTQGCPIIENLIAKGISDPSKICSEIGNFKSNGSRCGCLNDGECAMSTGDCCNGLAHHTAACGSNIRCGCIPDGNCAGLDGKNGCCSKTSHRTAACGSNIRCGTAADVHVVV
jgi:hypothetical protein